MPWNTLTSGPHRPVVDPETHIIRRGQLGSGRTVFSMAQATAVSTSRDAHAEVARFRTGLRHARRGTPNVDVGDLASDVIHTSPQQPSTHTQPTQPTTQTNPVKGCPERSATSPAGSASPPPVHPSTTRGCCQNGSRLGQRSTVNVLHTPRLRIPLLLLARHEDEHLNARSNFSITSKKHQGLLASGVLGSTRPTSPLSQKG